MQALHLSLRRWRTTALTLSKCCWIEVHLFLIIFLNISQDLCFQQVPILRIHRAKVTFLSITRQNVQSLTFYIPLKTKRCRATFLLTNPFTILKVLVILENRFIPLLRLVTTLISLPLMRPCPLKTMAELIIHLPSLNQVVTPPQTVQGISRPSRLREWYLVVTFLLAVMARSAFSPIRRHPFTRLRFRCIILLMTPVETLLCIATFSHHNLFRNLTASII